MSRALTIALLSALSTLPVLHGGCGGDTLPNMTFRLTNDNCQACSNPVYTMTVLRPAGVAPCVLVESTTTSTRPSIDGIRLADGDKATVVVELACPAAPTCAICYAQKDIIVAEGATHELALKGTSGCTVPALANPLTVVCP